MSRCLSWAIVGMFRVECLQERGHGGMHRYPSEPPCQHQTPLYSTVNDAWLCSDCGKTWG